MENNSLITLENSQIQTAKKRPDLRTIAQFSDLKNIRENYPKLSVQFVMERSRCVADRERRKTRETTARQYLKGVESYFRFNPDGEITADSARQWAASLADEGKQTSTQTAFVGGARRFFDWAIMQMKSASKDFAADNVDAQLLTTMIHVENPFNGIKLDKVERMHRRDELGATGARAFERFLDRHATDYNGKTTRLMCLLEMNAGCRSIELARLSVDDVRRGIYQQPPHIFLYRKGRTAKTAHVVSTKLAALLIEYIDKREGSEPLFKSQSRRNLGGAWHVRAIETRIREALKAANLKTDRISPHSLRHTNVNELLRAGVSIENVAGYEDHKSTATTMIYAHKVHELETQAAVVAQYEASRIADKPKRGRPKGSPNKKKSVRKRK